MKSWWVPYELGYGKKSQLELATLKRKGLEKIPEYLQVEIIIESKDAIYEWLLSIHKKTQVMFSESAIYNPASLINARIEKSATNLSHPLDKYLR